MPASVETGKLERPSNEQSKLTTLRGTNDSLRMVRWAGVAMARYRPTQWHQWRKLEGGEAMITPLDNHLVTTQFTRLEDHGRMACEAWVAVWQNDGRNIAIAAPTLDALRLAWLQITNLDLIIDRAQHVFFLRAS